VAVTGDVPEESRQAPVPGIEDTFAAMRTRLTGTGQPSVTAVAAGGADPFRVLVTTMISLRTKDAVTTAASQRLFAIVADAAQTAELPEQRIAELIYPAGFYRTKATNIRECASIIATRFGGKVPADRDLLLTLPGVGVKTANLTLNLGFGIPAICVDTHVHRIANRLGWIETAAPEASERALEAMLPRSYWIEINSLFVRYGQEVCTPTSPKCGSCPLEELCPKKGVTRHR
jgi:endonuclease III